MNQSAYIDGMTGTKLQPRMKRKVSERFMMRLSPLDRQLVSQLSQKLNLEFADVTRLAWKKLADAEGIVLHK